MIGVNNCELTEDPTITEKEKMLKGELYNADYDQELIKERANAKDLCFEMNNTKPSDIATRKSIIKKLLGKTGEEVHIESDFWCDYGYNITVGNPCKVIKRI